MESNTDLQFTDDEIWQELRKIGYDDISEDLFQQLKADLLNIIEQDKQSLLSASSKITFSPVVLSSESSRSCEDSSIISQEPTCSKYSASKKVKKKPVRNSGVKRNEENECPNGRQNPAEPRIIKRKILRHVNGKPVITEESRRIPTGIGSSKKWDSDTKSSSEEPIWHRLSSLSLSSSSSSNSSSSSSRSEHRFRDSSISLPNLNVKRKKCDPVNRYHQYKKYWDTFKPPGENKHSQLRWTIREKMLDYDFC